MNNRCVKPVVATLAAMMLQQAQTAEPSSNYSGPKSSRTAGDGGSNNQNSSSGSATAASGSPPTGSTATNAGAIAALVGAYTAMTQNTIKLTKEIQQYTEAVKNAYSGVRYEQQEDGSMRAMDAEQLQRIGNHAFDGMRQVSTEAPPTPGEETAKAQRLQGMYRVWQARQMKEAKTR
jgi:hypothetical protein